MIEIFGLTNRQKTYCDIIWAMEDEDAIVDFVATLPEDEQRECYTLMTLMRLAFLDDETQDCAEAKTAINKILSNIDKN